jgi:hypothetical protein
MKCVFNLLRKACGLSQQETSDYLSVVLDPLRNRVDHFRDEL